MVGQFDCNSDFALAELDIASAKIHHLFSARGSPVILTDRQIAEAQKKR